MQKINRFFWHCSGADVSILEKCPSETSKYVGIGATVFFTGVFAALAGAYAMFTVFQNYWIAAIFGLLWGLMIFNLDRYILSSMRKEGKFNRELLSALPRFILAILISIVIAKPIELKIFEREIEPELEVMRQETRKRQEEELKLRFTPEQERRRLLIANLKQEIFEKEKQRNELTRLAQEEADGTGGSMRRNLGPIYKIKKQDAERVEVELSELRTRNNGLIETYQADIGKSDSLMNASMENELNEITSGFAGRLEAMGRLAASSAPIWWANLFIILLFVIVETAPLMVKLLSPKGPYDNLLRVEEHRYAATEAADVARNSAEVRKQTETLSQQESLYLSGRLDAELK